MNAALRIQDFNKTIIKILVLERCLQTWDSPDEAMAMGRLIRDTTSPNELQEYLDLVVEDFNKTFKPLSRVSLTMSAN